MNDSFRLEEMHCRSCEGGVTALAPEEIELLRHSVRDWQVDAKGQRIRKAWRKKDFESAFGFLERVAAIAKQENHYPDLKLTGSRNVTIELTTLDADGLTANDFILAAKINQLALGTATP